MGDTGLSPASRKTTQTNKQLKFVNVISETNKVSERCDRWGMKLNAIKTNTMIVSSSCTMNPKSSTLTIGETVLKESDWRVILDVTFNSRITFEKHFLSVSRAASQRLSILKK